LSSFEFSELTNSQAVVFCISFNRPLCVEIMIDCWSRFAENTPLVIVDNSSDNDARSEIRNICTSHSVYYVGLPKNPEWNPNRSHALAMNWIYYNLVLEWEPKLFGYLDHDCFPYDRFSLTDSMSKINLWGDKRQSSKGDYWSLWAGFCFFRLSYVRNKKINFTHSIELGLDTGGCNWREIYSSASSHDLGVVQSITYPKSNLRTDQNFDATIDSFVHIGSAAHSRKAKKMTYDSMNQLILELNKRGGPNKCSSNGK